MVGIGIGTVGMLEELHKKYERLVYSDFALFPTRVSSGEWVWMQKYYYIMNHTKVTFYYMQMEGDTRIPNFPKIHTWTKEEYFTETLSGHFIDGRIAKTHYLNLFPDERIQR